MKFKDCLYESSFDLHYWYNKFNSELFGNQLPVVELVWVRKKAVGGTAIASRNKLSGIITVQKIEISNFYAKSDDGFKGILLHEMIHVYFLMQHKNYDHNVFFIAKIDELRKKVNFEIPITDSDTMNISDTVKAKEIGVVFIQKDTDYSIITFSKKIFEENYSRIKERLVNYFSGRTVTFLITMNKSVLKYPMKRTLGTFSSYRSTKEEYTSVMNDKSTKIL